MKVIIVADVNDDTNMKSLEGFLHNVLNNKVSLRLLPKKKRPFGSEWENKYVEGFNACVDEILGEQE